jgi:copper chaperone CopZ
LITVLLPADSLPGVLGGGIVSMLIMMLAGIPVYVCATASVPIAVALIAKGVSPGAALVFLMTGPATNAATIAMIARVMGRKTAAIYVGTVAICALGAGLLLDAIFSAVQIQPAEHVMHMGPGLLGQVSAVVLLAVLGLAIIWPYLNRHRRNDSSQAEADTDAFELTVRGMTCNHCKSAVERVLRESPGVDRAEVDLRRGRASVQGCDIDPSDLTRAVEEIGYAVTAKK